MKVLRRVAPTSEQLRIINDYKAGATVIRGAAGSGKTTTALLRLSFLVKRFRSRRQRLNQVEPVRVLVLTFNRTLRGYIDELARAEVGPGPDLDLTIATFGKWSSVLTGGGTVYTAGRAKVQELGQGLSLTPRFFTEEVDYILGRYLPGDLERYLTDRREGRGSRPRVEHSLRSRILNEVIRPFIEYKHVNGLRDWHDLALDLASTLRTEPYDVAIVDEAQDFTANQVRALLNHLATDHSVTFILDAAQRIYPPFFTWREVGLTFTPSTMFRLSQNHRNTKQIAAFASQLLANMDLTDDGTMPNLESCDRNGPAPTILVGTFSQQMAYVIDYIKRFVDLRTDSVAFLHPLGGGWFRYVRNSLGSAGLEWADIAREVDWPVGSENIALSTLHSAKGLEFDHVIMLGLNEEVLPQQSEGDDGGFETLQRLFAMAIGRAKTTLILGYKRGEAPSILSLAQKGTYVSVNL